MPLPDKISDHFFGEAISMDDLLSKLDPCLRRDLAIIEKHLRVLPDNIVFAADEVPAYIYIHKNGGVALLQSDDIKETVYACPPGPDYVYGLVAALSRTAYGMSMRTITNSEFDVIERDQFLSFIKKQPAFCFRLAEVLSCLCQNALNACKSH